jgi:hypothetical protein
VSEGGRTVVRRDPVRARTLILVVVVGLPAAVADEKPLTPVEARKQVGKEVTVRMEVKAAKDRLEKRGRSTWTRRRTSRTRRISRW